MNWYPMELGLYGLMATGLALFFAFPDPKVKKRGAAFFLGWFVPGAGHFLLGKRKKALFFFGALTVAYLIGLGICGFRTVSFTDNPFYYVGQFGCGLYMMIGHLLGAEKAFPQSHLPLSWYDPGLLYVCVAGLLNLVVAMNVIDAKLPDEEKKEEAKPEPEPPPEGETA